MLTNATEMELDSIDLIFELMIKQIKSKGMENYVIIEEITNLLALTLHEQREQELCTLHFDGAKSKNGVGVGFVLRYLYDVTKIYSFHLTCNCTNNATKHESLCLGLEHAKKLRIKCLTIFLWFRASYQPSDK